MPACRTPLAALLLLTAAGPVAAQPSRRHAAEQGVDPGRIVGAGGSAGGHLAAACALVPGFDTPGEDVAVSCKPNALVLFNPALHIPGRPVPGGDGKDVSATFWPTPFLAK